jgi:hypothetical protein
MASQPPAEIHLTSHREAWWMLFPAAAIGLVTIAAFTSALLFDEGPESDLSGWIVPGVSLGGIVVMVLLFWVTTVSVERALERRQVRRVYAHTLARWPQYATEAQWQQVIAKDARSELNVANIAWPMGILTAIMIPIGVGAGFAGIWSVTVVLAAFWVLVFGLVAGRNLSAERVRRNNRRRRERLDPYPACHLAAEGLYHEDWGLVTLDQVAEVRVISPEDVPQLRSRLLSGARKGEMSVELDPFDTRLARSGWSLLQFTIDDKITRTIWHHVQALLRTGQHGFHMSISIFHVRVPPGHEAEAAQVAAAVTRRWITAGQLR